MSHLLHYLPFSLADAEVSLYKIVQYQHDHIFNLLKSLRKTIKNHILTEESLMELRNTRKPDKHINVSAKLTNHKDKHNDLLEKLDEIEEDFKTHIKLYDTVHIHKL
jgi:hypothetical protein